MTETKMLPIALLYTRGREGVEGATRFQKLIFLAQEEYGLQESFEFQEDNYGPYSPQLAQSLDIFEDRGWVEKNVRTNEVGNEKHVFTLTTDGGKIAKSMVEKDRYGSIFDKLTPLKRKYNSWDLSSLLRYVYRKYPDYTTESELDFDRLFDPDARSQFLEPETASSGGDYIGPGPEEGLKMRRPVDDMFTIE